MPSKIPNKELIKKNSANWYKKNRSLVIKKQSVKRVKLAASLWEYKRGLFCTHCGVSFLEHPEWCDFHHENADEKRGMVNRLMKVGGKRLWEEIAKCIPLCANCHRTEHLRRRGEPELDTARSAKPSNAGPIPAFASKIWGCSSVVRAPPCQGVNTGSIPVFPANPF